MNTILTYEDKVALVQRFPHKTVELSYEQILHNKVLGSANVYMLVPKGKKGYVWFTYWQKHNVALFMPLNERLQIEVPFIRIYPACFSNEMALGSVLYGTSFEDERQYHHFTCENIYVYAGREVARKTFTQKLTIYQEIFGEHVYPRAYSNKFLIVGLPVMKMTYHEAMNTLQGCAYVVDCLRLYHLHDVHSIGIYQLLQNTNKNREEVYTFSNFYVKATPQMDLYELYCRDLEKPIGLAVVPSYKSSVHLNNLFRHIKENKDLDLLEMSDDESEFEDMNELKFVDLNKRLPMKCVYNKKFKGWQPIETLIGEHEQQISTFKESLRRK